MSLGPVIQKTAMTDEQFDVIQCYYYHILSSFQQKQYDHSDEVQWVIECERSLEKNTIKET